MDKYIPIHTCIELYITVLILAQHHTCQSESRVRCQKWFHFFHLDSGRISLPHDTSLNICCFGPKFHWDIAGLLRSFCKLRIQRNIGKLKPIIDLPAHSKILKMSGNGSRVSTHKNGWFQSFRCKQSDPHIVAWGPVLAIDPGDTALLE